VGTATDHENLEIDGSFFCQQNRITHVCAHAALRIAINSSPALAIPRKLTNEDINHALGIDHKDTVLNGGLDSQEIQQVLQTLGLTSHHADFRANLRTSYASFVYPFVDSRLPLILGIEAQDVQHVVAVLGHTLNSDRWAAEAKQGYGCYPISPYIPSVSWADHFLINDDNFGMHITLPAEMVQNLIVPRLNPNLHAAMAIGVVPSGTSLFGWLAEESAAGLAFDVLAKTKPMPANRWLVHLRDLILKARKTLKQSRPPISTIVCRTLLRARGDYLAALEGVVDSNGNSLQMGERQFLHEWLPEWFWVTEITLPNLYMANKRKLGDVISRVDATREEVLGRESIPFLWLPGIALWYSGGWNDEQWSLTGHVPLLRAGNVEAPLLEW